MPRAGLLKYKRPLIHLYVKYYHILQLLSTDTPFSPIFTLNLTREVHFGRPQKPEGSRGDLTPWAADASHPKLAPDSGNSSRRATASEPRVKRSASPKSPAANGSTANRTH